jgi:hypothetical protein
MRAMGNAQARITNETINVIELTVNPHGKVTTNLRILQMKKSKKK